MNLLGIWDGHDSGAVLLRDGRIVCAINEERLTRRKLEVAFPQRAIAACLEQGGIGADEVQLVACATFDIAKTLTRLWPDSKEKYYRIRRRLDPPSSSNQLIKLIKYKITEMPGNRWSHWLCERYFYHRMLAMGMARSHLLLLDHHRCHAACAACGSGFEEGLVLTLDGVGDGLSGSISLMDQGRPRRVASIAARDSLGIFFEHVTTLLHMRELEDEGKVMALADYTTPIETARNPLLDFFRVDGMRIEARFHANDLYRKLAEVYWRLAPEQFAAMAQQTLETHVIALVRNALRATNSNRIALAGGLFANVRLNGLIRNLPEVTACHVFPHMGDGGLALGAALCGHPEPVTPWPDLHLGPEYSDETIAQAIRSSGRNACHLEDPIPVAADLLTTGKIIGWFQGRMEYGPRALGGRSVLSLPGLPDIRETLNLRLKKRSWYQPFCPSMLDGEAERLLEDHHGPPDRYMTSLYRVKPAFRAQLSGVTGRDGSCRPQMVAHDSSPFSRLLQAIRQRTGLGVLLNTSFNSHGEPLVCSPQDALNAFAGMGIDALVMGNWLLQK
ncbi:MAG: hypothetical protein HQM03_11970 [Magnetococcales bacterium]|nr:hypothetical protein [Magnetococcales bacterium]